MAQSLAQCVRALQLECNAVRAVRLGFRKGLSTPEFPRTGSLADAQ